ncbi:ribonuclease H-like domain-containing protein [Tanacetum coccineum]
MCDEYKALVDNETWVLVPRLPNVNIVRSMWLYKNKYNADGFLSRYKARLVANGRSQQQGIDCDEIFSLVVKPATIHTVLSLAVSRQWPIHYYAIQAGFYHSKTDSSLFIFHKGPYTAYLLLYMDDIILIASVTSLLQRIISSLHAEFAMTDLGPLNYFLGRLSGYVPVYFWILCFLGDNLLTWSSKCQDTLSCSSAEAVYREVANAVAETSWIRNLLRELHTLLFTMTLVYCDNVSAV